jgi:hypothetical protein
VLQPPNTKNDASTMIMYTNPLFMPDLPGHCFLPAFNNVPDR